MKKKENQTIDLKNFQGRLTDEQLEQVNGGLSYGGYSEYAFNNSNMMMKSDTTIYFPPVPPYIK